MGGVASFVSDVVGDVFDAVGDVVEAVGDVVETVVEKIGDTVQAVIDNPLPVLIAVAGQMVGIPAPVTMGALTAAQGGDLEDIALSMGTAYFAPTVSSSLTSTFSSTLIESGFNETFSQVAGSSISRGLVNGTVAEIKGGSFDDAFAGGFTGGMVSGGVGEVASYVKPEVIEMAQESGLDLKDATALYNAGTRAFSAGITSEVTGRNDFTTAFTNSAIGSSVDYGTKSLNETIDQQFRTAATDWNEKDPEGNPVDVSITGAGIPNDLVTEVQVSDIGSDSQPVSEPESAKVATSDIEILPDEILAQAPEAETADKFSDLIDLERLGKEKSEDFSMANELPDSVIDIAQELPEENISAAEPKGALASMSEFPKSIDLSTIGDEVVATPEAPVISEAPVSGDLLTQGLAKPMEPPVGGLSAMAEKSPEQKMAEAQGLKATDFTKPLVATVGNLLKSTLTQGTRPAPRGAPPRPPQRPPQRPTGSPPTAQTPARPANLPPSPPPQRMDVAELIPIQKAVPLPPANLPPPKKPANAPAQRLDNAAKLTPIQNIAGLTSTVKKTG